MENTEFEDDEPAGDAQLEGAEDEVDEEEQEEEDEEEDDDEEDPEDEDFEPVDYWAEPDVIAFGDDLECKFDVSRIGEISGLIELARADNDYCGEPQLVFPGWRWRPKRRGQRTPWVEWFTPWDGDDPREAMAKLEADREEEYRVDHGGWEEIVEVWRYTNALADPIPLEKLPRLDPMRRAVVAQFNELKPAWLNARHETTWDLILDNLLRQAAVLRREQLRVLLARNRSEWTRQADRKSLTKAERAAREALRAELDSEAEALEATLAEAVAKCREVGAID